MNERVGYCLKDDVKSLFSGIDFDSNTALGAVKIENLITQWSAYMNGILRATYTLPITDHHDRELLGMICARFVAGDIDEILNAQAMDGTRKTRNLKAEAERMLDSFRDRENVLRSDSTSRVTVICSEDDTPEPNRRGM